eukprot:119115-Karenia_brevis.AAC.1
MSEGLCRQAVSLLQVSAGAKKKKQHAAASAAAGPQTAAPGGAGGDWRAKLSRSAKRRLKKRNQAA